MTISNDITDGPGIFWIPGPSVMSFRQFHLISYSFV